MLFITTTVLYSLKTTNEHTRTHTKIDWTKRHNPSIQYWSITTPLPRHSPARTPFLYSALILQSTKVSLSQSCSLCKQCGDGKKELLCSYLKRNLCNQKPEKICMCLWFPVADSNNSNQKTWSHKQKKKGKKGFPPNKSNTTLFAMMDYIPGLTAMPIMDIW